jgi:hypothetical protein
MTAIRAYSSRSVITGNTSGQFIFNKLQRAPRHILFNRKIMTYGRMPNVDDRASHIHTVPSKAAAIT